jgi:hypothetical protein
MIVKVVLWGEKDEWVSLWVKVKVNFAQQFTPQIHRVLILVNSKRLID